MSSGRDVETAASRFKSQLLRRAPLERHYRPATVAQSVSAARYSPRTTKRFPSPRCASASQILRPLESIAETQPQLQPALLRLSAIISQQQNSGRNGKVYQRDARPVYRESGLRQISAPKCISPIGAQAFEYSTRSEGFGSCRKCTLICPVCNCG
jgi:hypothetical protein